MSGVNAAKARAANMERRRAAFFTPIVFDENRRPEALYSWPRKVATDGIVAEVVVPGEPLSKQRPRAVYSATGIQVYTPKGTVEAEAMLRSAVRTAHRGLVVDAEAAFSVRVSFHAKTWQRRDVDNMTKLVLDACTGTIWHDDSQVVEIFARAVRGDTEARTELLVVSLGAGYLAPRLRCASCGNWFKVHPSGVKRGQRYCSRLCAKADRVAQNELTYGPRPNCAVCGKPTRSPRGVKVATCSPECHEAAHYAVARCARCGKDFRQERSILRRNGQRFCSAECRRLETNEKRRGKAWGTCEVCGGGTSRKEYTRCALHQRLRGRRSVPLEAGA